MASEKTDGGLGRLKRFLGGESAKPEGPPKGQTERRSGKRVPLPLAVEVTGSDGTARAARIRDVNLPGLAATPAEGVQVGDKISISFNGYPEVCPPFNLLGNVKRVVEPTEGAPPVMAIEIDRQTTPREAQQHYRSLVRHYLHHRPLLDDVNKGYFEGRCTSCEWIGRVGKRNPSCSLCGSKVVPV